MSQAPSEGPESSRPPVQPRTTKSYASSRGATPLGRGHRLKKPNIRLSSALSELDEPENPPEAPRPAPKRARRAPSSDNAGEDKRVRIWCHQCHQDRTTAATIECTSCTKSYCYSCLWRRYSKKLNEDEEQPSGWVCPRCQNYCDCIKCIRIRRVNGSSAPGHAPSPTTARNRRASAGESRVTRARAQRRSLPNPPVSASVPPPDESPPVVATREPTAEFDDVGSPVVGVKQEEPEWSTAAADLSTPSVSAASPYDDTRSLPYEAYESSEYAFDAMTPTSSSPPPLTPAPGQRTPAFSFSAENALRNFIIPADVPSISPHELHSSGTMLGYAYSPTIPHRAVDYVGDEVGLPVSKRPPGESGSQAGIHNNLIGRPLLLSDAPISGLGLGIYGDQYALPPYSAVAVPAEAEYAGHSIPADADSQPVIGSQEAATISSFLNDDMFV